MKAVGHGGWLEHLIFGIFSLIMVQSGSGVWNSSPTFSLARSVSDTSLG